MKICSTDERCQWVHLQPVVADLQRWLNQYCGGAYVHVELDLHDFVSPTDEMHTPADNLDVNLIWVGAGDQPVSWRFLVWDGTLGQVAEPTLEYMQQSLLYQLQLLRRLWPLAHNQTLPPVDDLRLDTSAD
jgi:hypothetical protein